tara:strand:- start:2293 stop:2520 length:228 start_codon:yes stop_codon:yes gene_type:complete
MPFNLELLREELSRYGTIKQLGVYHGTNLEINVKNSTGRQTTYERIENDLILPYFDKIESRFGNGYYKSAFIIKE